MALLLGRSRSGMRRTIQGRRPSTNRLRSVVAMLHRPLAWLCKQVRQPLLLYTIAWTVLNAAAVVVVCLSVEMAFSVHISRSLEDMQSCKGASCSKNNCLRLPLDEPHERLCVPPQLVKKSRIDYLMPPIFAGIVVGASAWFIHSLGLWECD